MQLRDGNEVLHQHDTPSLMIGDTCADESETNPVHPITLRFVNEGELLRDRIEVILLSGRCCVQEQVSRSLLADEVMAPCHEQHTWSLASSNGSSIEQHVKMHTIFWHPCA